MPKNKSTHKNNTSGITGVRWVEKRGKWHSYIRVNYKRINLGYYTDFEDAVLQESKPRICTSVTIRVVIR